MTVDVVVPALGESITEGTVLSWSVAVGAAVEVDDPLVEVETDKITVEVPSPVSGVVRELVVEEGKLDLLSLIAARPPTPADLLGLLDRRDPHPDETLPDTAVNVVNDVRSPAWSTAPTVSMFGSLNEEGINSSNLLSLSLLPAAQTKRISGALLRAS